MFLSLQKYFKWFTIIILVLVSGNNSYGACDYSTSDDFSITPSGTHNTDPTYTQVYLLTDLNGIVIATSSTGNFGPQSYGVYNVHALNYGTLDPPSPLPSIGTDVNTISGGCMNLFSLPTDLTVCDQSITTACENSGEIIKIVSQPDYNMNSGFNQIIVIVDQGTGLIVSVSPIDPTGTIIQSTETGTGDLNAGTFSAYAVNYQDPETPSSLGLAVGLGWTGTFGPACANATPGINILVEAPGSCVSGTSTLSACENSGDVISIHSSTYNTSPGFNQVIVVVDSLQDTIVAIKPADANGMAVFTTTTGTGDLPPGAYHVYGFNYENPATLLGMGVIVGGNWPPAIGVNCAEASEPAPAVVTESSTCEPPLLVEQLLLWGKVENQNHILHWNNLDFQNGEQLIFLEHSDSKSGFSEIFAPKESDESNFSYKCQNAGLHYYRLKETGRDGTLFKVSNTINLFAEEKWGFNILDSDNIKEKLSVKFWTDKNEQMKTISIMNQFGNKVYESSLSQRGNQEVNIPLPYSSGVYLIQLTTNQGQRKSEKFIIRDY